MAHYHHLTDKDVLLGRGSAVISTPGNQLFRQLIADHRRQYTKAPRLKKMRVARIVIAIIHEHGGNYVRMEDNDETKCVVVDSERALEKTCQALREQPKDRLNAGRDDIGNIRPATFPLKSKFVIKKAIPNHTKKEESTPQGKRQPRGSPANQSPRITAYDSTYGSNSRAERKKHQHRLDLDPSDDYDDSQWILFSPASAMLQIMNNHKEWEDWYTELHQFYSAFGHSCVPPEWPGNPELADWAVIQRQLHREIRCGYREANADEKLRWKRLEGIGFELDFANFHWTEKYNELMDILKGAKYTNRALIPPNLRQWIDEQLYHNPPTKPKQIRKLMQIGVIDENQKGDEWLYI